MRYLGLDLGTKTLGIALTDRMGMISNPYTTLKFKETTELIQPLKKLIEEQGVSEIALGLPKNMNNSLGIRAEETIFFKEKLEQELNIEVILEDERLTTKVAESILIQADMSRKKRKKKVDGVSAVIILQSYLDRKENK